MIDPIVLAHRLAIAADVPAAYVVEAIDTLAGDFCGCGPAWTWFLLAPAMARSDASRVSVVAVLVAGPCADE